ncbi:MAG: hypothetical protein U1F76_11290 [Candidatus Competibacteraceae bacterium]
MSKMTATISPLPLQSLPDGVCHKLVETETVAGRSQCGIMVQTSLQHQLEQYSLTAKGQTKTGRSAAEIAGYGWRSLDRGLIRRWNDVFF